MHRWDLAKATGGDTTIADDEIAHAWQDAEVYGDNLRSRGAFGPQVEAPADADEQTKLLAFLGRQA